MALVVAMAGMMLPAIPEDMLTTVDWGGGNQVCSLTFDLKFRVGFDMEYSRSEVGRSCNKVQSILVILVEGQDWRGLV